MRSRLSVVLCGLWSVFGFGSLSEASDPPTFHKDVEPILQSRCQDCHRAGEIAPFSLLTYDNARKRAADLAALASERKMPPWPASTTEGGPFQDARVLTDEEIAVLTAWADAGAPRGNPADAPAPRTFTSGWPLGEPDLVLRPEEAYHLAAGGEDVLRVFVIPSGLTEGKWVRAIDFQPGNPQVVHHILAAFDTLGRARVRDARDPEPGYDSFAGFGIIPSGGLGGWAPGKRPQELPSGVGRYLPARSDILIQVHYHKTGKPETDATAIGIYFSDEAPDKQIHGGLILPPRPMGFLSRPTLSIPAGDANHEVRGTGTIEQDSHLTAVVPHMHWLGKDFSMTAHLPDGTERTLIKIDQWDFNWQGTYDFVEPIALPAGTRIDMVAHFDNSDANPANPNHPPKPVHWGQQTTDEMCIGFYQVTHDAEHLHGKPPERFRAAGR